MAKDIIKGGASASVTTTREADATPLPPEPHLVEVLKRRIENPFSTPSRPIALFDGSRTARWFNSALSADRVWTAKQKGWRPIKPADVVDLDQVAGYTLSPDGYICRGDRCQEVLMSMPRDAAEAIANAKTKWNLRNMGNPNAQRAELQEAAGTKYGDQAAEFLGKTRPVGQVVDSHERIHADDVAE